MSALGKKGGMKSASLLAAFVTALLAFVGMGGASAAFATGGSSTTSISAKALDSHGCDSSEWHFVITQVASEAQAPASISVEFANGKTVSVSLDKVTGGTAHYATTQYLDSKVVSATTNIYEGWSGQFNLSHGPCGTQPPPPPTKIANPTFTLTGVCGVNNDTVNASSTEDYTAGEPVWKDSKVSVTFTMKDGVNKVFANGEKSVTVTKDEVNTEDCTQPPPPPTKIANPTFTLTGVCGVNNDTVNASSTEDYTAGEPVWKDSKVSVTFTMKDGVNKVFANGEKSVTVTKDEVNTEDCSAPDETTTTATSPECGVILVSGHVDKSYDNVRVSVTVAGQTKTSTGNDFSIRFTDVPAGTYTPEGVFVWGDEGQADGLSFNSVTVKDCSTQHPTEIPVPTVPVIDECGPGNAHYGDVPSGNYTVVRNEDGSITLTAKDGYIFPNGQESVTLPKPVEKNTQPCPVIAPKASLSSECEIVDGAKSGYTVVNAVFDNTGSNEEVTFEVVETIDGVTNVYPIPVAAGEKATPQVFYSQEDGKKVSLAVNARDVALANLSFETATCAATVTPPPPPPTKTCPAGTKWVDLNHNGKVDSGECKTPEKPKPPVVTPPFKCPSGMTGSDKNHNGKVDKGECKAPAKHVVPGSGAPHTGGGDLIDLKDAMALGLVLMAGGGLLIRRRKLAQVS